MRGTAIGEKVVSKAETKEFDAGHERIFGVGRRPQVGKWVYDRKQGKLVPVSEFVAPVEAKNASIMMDRFYENTCATDGTDIGSRRKHREYMRRNGLTTVDDFPKTWNGEAKNRAEYFTGGSAREFKDIKKDIVEAVKCPKKNRRYEE